MHHRTSSHLPLCPGCLSLCLPVSVSVPVSVFVPLSVSRCPSLCAGLPLSVLCCVITCCLCFRCAALRVVLCAVLCRLPAASHVARRAASAPLVPCCVRLFLVSPSASSLPGGRDCLLSYFSLSSSACHTFPPVFLAFLALLRCVAQNLAFADFFSRGHDPFTHACKARPLTDVGWTFPSLSLSCHVVVHKKASPEHWRTGVATTNAGHFMTAC